MTDDPDDEMSEMRQFVRHLFASVADDAPPADIVPPSALTREEVLRWNELDGTWVELRTPGEPVEDVDGNIIGMTESTVESAYFSGAGISRRQLVELGLTEKEIPNVRIID